MYLALNLGDAAFWLKPNDFLGWEEDFSDMFLFRRLKALSTNFRTIQHHKPFSLGNPSCYASAAPTSLDLGIAAISCLQCSTPGLSSPDTERTLSIANQPWAHTSLRNISRICSVHSFSFLLILLGGGGTSFAVCNFPKLRNWSIIYCARSTLTLTFSWTLCLKHRATKIWGYVAHSYPLSFPAFRSDLPLAPVTPAFVLWHWVL